MVLKISEPPPLKKELKKKILWHNQESQGVSTCRTTQTYKQLIVLESNQPACTFSGSTVETLEQCGAFSQAFFQ